MTQLFKELRQEWLKKVPTNSTATTEEYLSGLSLPLGSKTSLCYFGIPNDLVSFYSSHVFPVFRRNGLTPITINDIISSNQNVIATAASLVEKSTIVVIDISPFKTSYSFELYLALSLDRTIIIIEERDMPQIERIQGQRVKYIERPRLDDVAEQTHFISQLETYLKEKLVKVKEQIYSEPRRLQAIGEYRHAAISAFILIESELREKLQTILLMDRDPSLRRLVEFAGKFHIIDRSDYSLLLSWIPTRNRLIHTNEDIDPGLANEIVDKVFHIIDHIHVEKPKILNEKDRRILGTRYLHALCKKSNVERRAGPFSKYEIYKDAEIGAYNSEVVIPLIVQKLKQLKYIRERNNDEISITNLGREHCHDEVTLDESI